MTDTTIYIGPNDSVTVRRRDDPTPDPPRPVDPPRPPDPTPPSGAAFQGDFPRDGHTYTGSVSAGGTVYWRIQVPNPLPPGAAGYLTHIGTVSGVGGDIIRVACLSRVPGDTDGLPPARVEGISTNNAVAIGSGNPRYKVVMQAGETWYWSVTAARDLSFHFNGYFPW